jgi:predicted small lipoprotein YifL
MNRICQISIVVVATIALLGGCAKDEGPLYIPEPVDPEVPMDTVHFSTEVMPIFQAHCWVCHPPMGGGMDLTEGMAYSELVGVTSNGYDPAVRVSPGNVEASVLWHKISFSGDFGLGMPPNGAPLSSDEIETIQLWIEQGAMDN